MNCFDKVLYFSKIYMHEWIPVNEIDMVVSRYAIPTGIPCIDMLSTGPPDFAVSQLHIRSYVYEYLGLGGHGFKTCGYSTELKL